MGKSRSKRRFFQRCRNGAIDYNAWLQKFANNAISSYNVDGLPIEIDERWLNLKLFTLGSVAFFYDDILEKYLVMQYTTLGKFDCYGNPREIHVYDNWNGYNRVLKENEFVIIWDNQLRQNLYTSFVDIAYRLWRIDGTIDVNCSAQKTPVIVQCGENERLSFKNMIAEVDADSPYIALGDKLAINNIKALQLNAPFVSPQLLEVQQTLYNRGNAMLGITSVAVQKKERLVKSEVETANADALANRRSRTFARDLASRQIKEKFGLDITWTFDNGDEPFKDLDVMTPEELTSEMKRNSLLQSALER